MRTSLWHKAQAFSFKKHILNTLYCEVFASYTFSFSTKFCGLPVHVGQHCTAFMKTLHYLF